MGCVVVATIRVRNLAKFQHYSDRNPPWVKLHSEVFTNYDFGQLPDETKWHALALVLLASKMDNVIPNDPAWIQERTQSKKRPNINQLLKIGFLEQDASDTLQTSEQNGGTEERRDRGEKPSGSGASSNGECPEEYLPLKARLESSQFLNRTDLFDWPWWSKTNEVHAGKKIDLFHEFDKMEEYFMRKPQKYRRLKDFRSFVSNWLGNV